jgi:hypothetical protein
MQLALRAMHTVWEAGNITWLFCDVNKEKQKYYEMLMSQFWETKKYQLW